MCADVMIWMNENERMRIAIWIAPKRSETIYVIITYACEWTNIALGAILLLFVCMYPRAVVHSSTSVNEWSNEICRHLADHLDYCVRVYQSEAFAIIHSWAFVWLTAILCRLCDRKWVCVIQWDTSTVYSLVIREHRYTKTDQLTRLLCKWDNDQWVRVIACEIAINECVCVLVC